MHVHLAATLQLIARKPGAHEDMIWSIVSSSNCTHPSAAHPNPTTLYSHSIPHTHGCRSVRFSPDGMMIVSGGWDKAVKVWSSALELIAEEPDAHGVCALQWSVSQSVL